MRLTLFEGRCGHRWIGVGSFACPVCGEHDGDHHRVELPVQVEGSPEVWRDLAEAATRKNEERRRENERLSEMRVYEARPGDRYLSRTVDGVEYRLASGEEHPYGVLAVRVVAVADDGVVEETIVRGAGRPERFSRGWAYSGVKSHGDEWRGSGESYFRRTRRHPVYAMGDGEATSLLDRLRAKDLAERNKTDDERRREREALHLIKREAQA